MDDLFRRFFGDWGDWPALTAPRGDWLPAVEVAEQENAVVVKAELPGLPPRNCGSASVTRQLGSRARARRQVLAGSLVRDLWEGAMGGAHYQHAASEVCCQRHGADRN